MLPLSLFLGMVSGAAIHDRTTLRRSLGIGVVASGAWAVAIAIAGEPLYVFGGFALAFVNHVVGMVFGAGLRGGARLVAGGMRRWAH